MFVNAWDTMLSGIVLPQMIGDGFMSRTYYSGLWVDKNKLAAYFIDCLTHILPFIVTIVLHPNSRA